MILYLELTFYYYFIYLFCLYTCDLKNSFLYNDFSTNYSIKNEEKDEKHRVYTDSRNKISIPNNMESENNYVLKTCSFQNGF
jgi:hypothetical protein